MIIAKSSNVVSKPCFCVCAIVFLSTFFSAGCGTQDKEDLGFGYDRRGNHIYFTNTTSRNSVGTRIDNPPNAVLRTFESLLGSQLVPCKSLDAATFEALSEEYTRDKNKVYFKWISPGVFLVVELQGADPATFKPLNYKYAVDKNSIWFMDSAIPGSDPATATLLSDQIVQDKFRIYSNGEPSNHPNATSIRPVGSDYYVDDTNVYWGTEIVKGADPASFEVLANSFLARDKGAVYRNGLKLPNIDAESCKFIFDHPYGYQVFSDKNGVYVSGRKFLYADPADFKQVAKHLGKGNGKAFLVDESQHTPLTVYRNNGRLMVEGLLFDWKTNTPIALAKAEVISSGMKDIVLLPPPGGTETGEVKESIKKDFQRDFIVQEILKAAKWLD